MSPVIKIAWRKLRREGRRGLVAASSTLLSHVLISFFIGFALRLSAGPAAAALPAAEFFARLKGGMIFSAVTLAILAMVSIRIRCRGRREENRQTLAVLTSIGASAHHKLQLLILEFAVLYAPAILGGSLVGCLMGMRMGNLLSETDSELVLPALEFSLALAVAGLILTAFFFFLPPLRLGRLSLIGSIRRQETTALVKHGYRNSQTFRKDSLPKRLAKKSVDYYADIYGGIALGFFLTVMYPVLTVLLVVLLGDAEVVLDINPNDSIDTAGAVLSAVNRLLAFLAGTFAALTAVGFLQAYLMARDQVLRRRESAKVYRTVGMTESDVRRMISYELRSVSLRVFVYLVVGVLIVYTIFSTFI